MFLLPAHHKIEPRCYSHPHYDRLTPANSQTPQSYLLEFPLQLDLSLDIILQEISGHFCSKCPFCSYVPAYHAANDSSVEVLLDLESVFCGQRLLHTDGLMMAPSQILLTQSPTGQGDNRRKARRLL